MNFQISKTDVLVASGLRDDNVTGRSIGLRGGGRGEREREKQNANIVEIGRASEQRRMKLKQVQT